MVDGVAEPVSISPPDAGHGRAGGQRVVAAGGGGGSQMCVGGSTVEADVAGVALWTEPVSEEELAGTSECAGPRRSGAPRLSLDSWWVPQGSAAPATFPLQQVCAAAPRLVVVRPAGTFRGVGVLCEALGGTVAPAAALEALLPALNASCVGPAGLLS